MGKVVHCKKENYDVYIGRPTIWGNPFSHKKLPGIVTVATREEAVAKYKEYLLSNKFLMSKIHELEGKILGCWCAPQACHGDIILEVLKNKK